MKKLNIHPLQEMTIGEISVELNQIALGKYTIYVDLYNGNVNIGRTSRCKQNELVIGKVEFLENSKKKHIKEFYHNVYKVIHNYHKSGILISRSRANKEYSKKYIEKFNPVLVVDNPYNKYGEPICLYDSNVLKFNTKKYEKLLPSMEVITKRKEKEEKRKAKIREEKEKQRILLEEIRKRDEAEEKGVGKETPPDFLDNVEIGIINSKMLGEVIYSYNKRAKNMRDKEHSPYYSKEKCRQNKENLYSKKDALLKFVIPTAIHKVKRIRSRKVFDWDWDKFIDLNDEEVYDFYDRNGDYHEFCYETFEKIEYYLFFEVGNFSFHSPINEKDLGTYSDLAVTYIGDLITEGKDVQELLSLQFCDKVYNGLMDGSLKICADNILINKVA